jgi:hypothetical protein
MRRFRIPPVGVVDPSIAVNGYDHWLSTSPTPNGAVNLIIHQNPGSVFGTTVSVQVGIGDAPAHQTLSAPPCRRRNMARPTPPQSTASREALTARQLRKPRGGSVSVEVRISGTPVLDHNPSRIGLLQLLSARTPVQFSTELSMAAECLQGDAAEAITESAT